MESLKSLPVALFIDDGGVLNDNRLRGPEWLRLLGEFMPARLGGTGESWASANKAVFPPLWKRIQGRMGEFSSYRQFIQFYASNWLLDMCNFVGVQPVPEDEALLLYREASCYVAERAECEIKGAADAVRSLHRADYTLYMGSGTPSWELAGILGKMGIRDAFSTLYGPDLIDHVKYGPAFYEKLFADAGVSPDKVLVVESDSECCGWASEAGANVVWVDASGKGDEVSLEGLAGRLV